MYGIKYLTITPDLNPERERQTKTQQTASERTSFFSILHQFVAFPPVFMTDCLTETKHTPKKSALSLKTPGQVQNDSQLLSSHDHEGIVYSNLIVLLKEDNQGR